MKTKVAHLPVAASILALAFSLANPALAQGTAAGVLIENTAEASYDSGASTVTIRSNTVTIKVDEILDVSTAAQSVSQPDGATAVFAFNVQNTGNGSEAFNLVVSPSQPGNDYDVTVTQLVIDDGDGVYEPGIDVVLPSGSPTPVIAADSGITVFVVATIPATAQDGDVTSLKLDAVATTGSGTPGTVFIGQGDSGSDAVVGASTANQGAAQSLTVGIASVSLGKTATVVDPFSGSESVPGAIVTYSLVATVSGSGSVGNLHVIDAIPAGTTYQSGTLTLDGNPLTDAVDADAGTATSSGIDVSVGTQASGSSHTVTFQVKIN